MTLCIEVTVQKEKEGKTSERGVPSHISKARGRFVNGSLT